MKKTFLFVLLSLVASLLLTVATSSSPAFADTTPIDCSNVGMIQVISDNDNHITVYEMDVIADPVNASLTQLFQVDYEPEEEKFNGAGVNPADDILYGSLKLDNGDGYFVRLGSDGFEYLFQWNVGHNYIGAFDSSGTYHYSYGSFFYTVANPAALTGYESIAAADAAAVADPSVTGYDHGGTTGADIVIVEDGGKQYAISISNSERIRIANLTDNGPITPITQDVNMMDDGTMWGAMYSFGDFVYASDNGTAGVWQIPWKSYLAGETPPAVSVVENSVATDENDGANCVDEDPPELPCGFEGLDATLMANDPGCVEVATNIVDTIECSVAIPGRPLQLINTDTAPTGIAGTVPYSDGVVFDVNMADGTVLPFDPSWVVNLASRDIRLVNAFAVNPLDQKMYMMVEGLDGTTQDGYSVVRFDPSGDLEFVIPANGGMALGGTFTSAGRYVVDNGNRFNWHDDLHLKEGWPDRQSMLINNDYSWTQSAVIAGGLGYDITAVENDAGQTILHTVDERTTAGNEQVQIITYNMVTGTADRENIDLPDPTGRAYGAAYHFNDNSVYFSSNLSQGIYKILWDEPRIDGKVQFAYVMPSVDTNANDGASCPISPSPFPCEWDDTLSASDAACVPAVDYSVDNQMHCVANGHTRTYSITNASDVVGVVTMTDVDAATSTVKNLDLDGTVTFTDGVDFTIVDDEINDFTITIDWIDVDDDTVYTIEIPTTIGNNVDCDPEAYFTWANSACPGEAVLSWDLSFTIHSADISVQLAGGSLEESTPITQSLTAGNTGTITIPIADQTTDVEITATLTIAFSNGESRTMAFTHGSQNCLAPDTSVNINADCLGSSVTFTNSGDYNLTITVTNNGTATTYTVNASNTLDVALGWTEGTTNTLSYSGTYPDAPDNDTVTGTLADWEVRCSYGSVNLAEDGGPKTFTISPPCNVTSFGIDPVDTDPDTEGVQATDEFTYSIEQLENGDLRVTVEDIDDTEIDGTTFDNIIVWYTGADCGTDDCLGDVTAQGCEIEVEVPVLDNDNPEELAATGISAVRIFGFALLIAIFGYGIISLTLAHGPQLMVRAVTYRKVTNRIRVEGSRKIFKISRKIRKD
tara:strand:- start:3912 stop:7214 length:3303 start_codon:yes stop_codon:yes gene_type:complete